MTTNSFGSPLPASDFPPSVAKVATAGHRGLPRSAKLAPLFALGLAYYVGSQISSRRETSLMQGDAAAHRKEILENAYGDRSSLKNLEAAMQAYTSTSIKKPPL